MAITDEQVIKYVNEQVRPMGEELRALESRMEAFLADYFAGVNTTISADGEGIVEDGRETDGISRLTGNDVMAVVTRVQSIKAIFDASNAMDCIHKSCVRPLRAE